MPRIIPLADARASSRRDALDRFVRAAANEPAVPDAAADTRGRAMRDLRISVTDRCNFRCVYCMPKEVYDADHEFLPRADLLTFEEITRVARIFVAQGVTKLRLTGGEPLLRRNIERLVEMLARLGDVDLTLTTNGTLLGRKARSLRDAGLTRVTVSLDSLDDATFRAMNDVDFPVAKVLEGIDAAAAAGLAPVKVNMVVKRGTNEASIVPMARHFKGSGHIVRYIEYMDVGATNGWRMDDVVPAGEIVRAIDAELPLESADPNYPGEVAERWRYRDGGGEIGVIASVTQAFCRDCTRVRLSTDGKIYTCLFATDGYDLRALLREGAGDAPIGNAIAAVWRQRADRYSEIRTGNTAPIPKIEMSYIGG
jgi:cyclic pyranopterin phosphate synthase